MHIGSGSAEGMGNVEYDVNDASRKALTSSKTQSQGWALIFNAFIRKILGTSCAVYQIGDWIRRVVVLRMFCYFGH